MRGSWRVIYALLREPHLRKFYLHPFRPGVAAASHDMEIQTSSAGIALPPAAGRSLLCTRRTERLTGKLAGNASSLQATTSLLQATHYCFSSTLSACSNICGSHSIKWPSSVQVHLALWVALFTLGTSHSAIIAFGSDLNIILCHSVKWSIIRIWCSLTED
jgi:hypothetical protein